MIEVERTWERGVDVCRPIGDLGFRLEMNEASQRVKIARFVSHLLVFEYSVDLLLGEISGHWRDQAGSGVPDPLLAICYFEPELDPRIEAPESTGDDLQLLGVAVDLYLAHPWALTSTRWLMDEGFNNALRIANEWAFREFRPLKPGEFEKMLRTNRRSDASVMR